MRLLAALFLVSAVLAGCSGGSPKAKDVTGGLDVTDTTGGIRGLVVDQAVVPIAGAFIALSDGSGRNTTSDAEGLFNFTGLAPGTYVLDAGKAGFTQMQTTVEVEAGVPDPPIVKILLSRLTSAQPYLDFFKLDGFYECAHAVFFVTDTCDWVPRTAWDQYNESTGSPPPTPRSALSYYNTQYIDVPADTYAIIQEGYWTDESVGVFWVMLDETPIDASCDCSDSYTNVVQGSPTYNRMDRYDALGNENTNFTTDLVNGDAVGYFPAGYTVAARGFIPFMDEPACDFLENFGDPAACTDPANQNTDPNTWYAVAQNFHFTIVTSLFHNYVPPDGWTFETKDQYQVG